MGPSVGMGAIQSFYTSAYDLLNTDGNAVVLHDAFETPQAWNEFLPGLPNMYVVVDVVLRNEILTENSVIDTHHYEVFDAGQLAMDTAAHVQSACSFGAAMATDTKWTISGEWYVL
jgi:glucan 1,3-beta-glucosidase